MEMIKLGNLIAKATVERCGDDSYPVYSMTMHDGIIKQADRFKKAVASKNTSSYKIVRKNQLVVGFPIDEGVIYVQNYDQPGIMSPAYNIWDFDQSKVLPAYLELALHSPQSMAYYADKMRGTTARRRTLTEGGLKSLLIPLPPMSEQHKIVDVLSKIKTLTASSEKHLAALDSLVKSRFVEMFGDPTVNNLGLPVTTISDYGANKDSERKPVTKSDRIEGIYPYYGASGVVDYVSDYLFDEPLLLISEDGANLLARTTPIAFLIKGKTWVNNHAHIVSCKKDFDGLFLACLINMLDISEYVTGSAQPKLNQAKLNSIPLIYPPESARNEFAAFVTQVDKLRFETQQQIEKLEVLKKSLMQEYFG